MSKKCKTKRADVEGVKVGYMFDEYVCAGCLCFYCWYGPNEDFSGCWKNCPYKSEVCDICEHESAVAQCDGYLYHETHTKRRPSLKQMCETADFKTYRGVKDVE